jgi:hypothetical protein
MVSSPRISIGPAGCRINRDYASPCHRAAPETTPLWRLFLIKALSLSLSLSLSLVRVPFTGKPEYDITDHRILDFGVFAFLSFSLGPAGDRPCRH